MIPPKYDESIARLAREIKGLVADLPQGKRNAIGNKLSKITIITKKMNKRNHNMDTEIIEQSSEQIANRYIAKQAILNAMIGGRAITFLDSKEFKVSEMHTQMCVIGQDIERKKLPYILHRERYEFAPNRYCKKYWIEKVQEEAQC